jgi:hypothetical protein
MTSIKNSLFFFVRSNYQYQLIEMLVQQVAMDQSNIYPEDISHVSEFTVQSLIPKFSAGDENNLEDNIRRVHSGNCK